MDHADAETRRAAWARGAAAAESPEPAAATPTAPAAAPTAAAAAKTATEVVELTIAARGVDAAVRIAREPYVRVRAALGLGLEERDVGQPLELRIEDSALRRLRDEVADEVAGRDGHARQGDGL